MYFVDNQRVSQGVFRISYVPSGDSEMERWIAQRCPILQAYQRTAILAAVKQAAHCLEPSYFQIRPHLILKGIFGLVLANQA